MKDVVEVALAPIERLRRIRSYVLVVTTGRSGSAFFASLVNDNAGNAMAEHEPHVVSGNLSTRWFYDGNREALADLARRKLRRLRRGEILASVPFGETLHPQLLRQLGTGRIPTRPVREVYVEVDNGALKSWGPAMLEAVPEMRIVHLTRNPLLQAKSAENRGSGPSPDRPYFLWPVWERNLLRLDAALVAGLSKFQLALWYWIEMELRYARFFALAPSGPNLEVDVEELNDAGRVGDILAALGIRHGEIRLSGGRNSGERQSLLSGRDYEEARAFLGMIPADALDPIANTYGLEAL